MAAKNRQRWRFTKGKQYKCTHCGCRIDKRWVWELDEPYIYCSATCHMHDVGMSWSDFC
ncbi:hypothetical protein [Cytobacillus pseudoceanisediminis]